MEEKKELRQRILHDRRELLPSVLAEKSSMIQKQIFASKEYQEAKRVFTFVSMPREVDTIALIEQAWEDKKIVYVPVTEKGGIMYFVSIESTEELFMTEFGVLEPRKTISEQEFPQRGDLFFVPGTVFDRRGNRIGYGGGFYDRYFALGGEYQKIGMAFSFQVMDEDIPTEEFDVAVDAVITEREWIGGRKK